MQLLTILLFAVLMQVSATTGAQTVTVSGKKMTLPVLFDAIRQQTGYEFLYSPKTLELGKPFSIDVKNAEVPTVLSIGLKNQPFKYEIIDKTIVISRKSEFNETAAELSPQLASPGPVLEIPPITVKGRIVNENGEPVIASVTIQGTNRGTTSDANGEFELAGVEENAILIITATNIEKISVKIEGRTNLSVRVRSSASSLDEVVFKGYYKETRALTTGSVGKVAAHEIRKQPVSNPLLTLQGRIPGVQITQQSGVPGSPVSILIRGRNSLRTGEGLKNGSLPLYVINGTPFPVAGMASGVSSLMTGTGNPLNNINPADIESIEILKDADATSIYGSRGANGVVLITTKQAKGGKTRLDVDAFEGYGKVGKKVDLLNTKQYLIMRNEAFSNDQASATSTDVDLMLWDTTRYTDWQKELIGGTAKYSNIQTSVSGGSDRTQFSVGAGYFRETTVFPGDFAHEKLSARFNVNHSSKNERFQINFGSNYTYDNNQLFTTDLTARALSLSPNAPRLLNDDGTINWEEGSWDNPIAYIKSRLSNKTRSLIANINTSYLIVKGLKIGINAGYTDVGLHELRLNPIVAQNPFNSDGTGVAQYGNNAIRTWNIEPQLNYSINFGTSALSLVIGNTFQKTSSENDMMTAKGYTDDQLLKNLKAATSITIDDFNKSLYKYSGIYARVNYNLKDKYVLNATVRRDGSTRFGKGRQFGNFGSVGAAYIFHNEKLFETFKFLSFGKIRSSYGISGNDQIGNYGYLDLWAPYQYGYGGNIGLYPEGLPNPLYSWESNKKFNVGIDLGFAGNKINLTAEYFINRSSNQLVEFLLPFTTGFNTITANFPATVQNSGLEFSFTTNNIETKNFQWITTFNISVPKNKLISFPGIKNSPYYRKYEVGRSLDIQYGFISTGINDTTGIYSFIDVDKDGINNEYGDDNAHISDLSQKFYGGLQNSFSYKNFQLSFLFQFVKQTVVNSAFTYGLPGTMKNQPVAVLDRWQEPGDVAKYQKFSQIAYSDPYLAYSYISSVEDGSFIRLKNLALSYDFYSILKSNSGFRNLKVYLQAQNLLTITKYKGMDPESGAYNLPPLKAITFGIQFAL